MVDYSKFLFDAFSGPGDVIRDNRIEKTRNAQIDRNYAHTLDRFAYEKGKDQQDFNYRSERDRIGDSQWQQGFNLQQRTANRLDAAASRPSIETFYDDQGRETKGIYDPSSPLGFRPVGGSKTPTGNIPNGYQMAPGGGLTFIPGGPADPAVISNLAGARGQGGGSGGARPLPAEIGARIGLGNQFVNVDLPAIRAEIEKGTLGGKGLLNNAEAMFNMGGGFGKAGEVNRRIQTGLDALRRNLTGQGMSMSEAQDYVNRYVPGVADSIDTINSKLNGLEADLNATAAGATAGREPPPSMMPNGQQAPAVNFQTQHIEAEMRRRGLM
ncbi:hypothetical protein [Kaistia adipata]|uniref:hypothetical protein n=1 Tax=Kaistia adipata TaxID=166954 RepID=UPI00048E817C|nr:hypothetical protein [Kaistia adipata]